MSNIDACNSPSFTSQKNSCQSPPRLKAKVKNDLVLEDSNEQHDGKSCQQTEVLQDEVSKLAALVVLTVPMKHFRQL